LVRRPPVRFRVPVSQGQHHHPTRNGRHLLGRCVESVISKSVYNNFELVVVDNQSDDPTRSSTWHAPRQVLRYPHEFNYPRQLNLAVAPSTAMSWSF